MRFKRLLCALTLIISIIGCYAGPADSIYYLHVGGLKYKLVLYTRTDSTSVNVPGIEPEAVKKQPGGQNPATYSFKPGRLGLAVNPVTLQNMVVKDTIIKYAFLEPESINPIGFVKLRNIFSVDTVMQINPVNLFEDVVITTRSHSNIEFNAGNIDPSKLRQQLNTGFIIENGLDTIKLKEISVLFQNTDTSGLITLEYPKPDNALINKMCTPTDSCFMVLLMMIPAACEPFYTHILVQPGSGPSVLQPITPGMDDGSKTHHGFLQSEIRDSLPASYFKSPALLDSIIHKAYGITENYTISTFQISLWTPDTMQSMQGKGNRLTQQMKQLLLQAKPGDIVMLENIYIIIPGGNDRWLKRVAYKVKGHYK